MTPTLRTSSETAVPSSAGMVLTSPRVVTAERQACVDRARHAWIHSLIDLSRRNNLLYFRDLKTGTLDISGAPSDVMQDLLQSSAAVEDGGVPLTRFVPSADLLQASRCLCEIVDRARSNLEERGLDTLFLGLGLVTWPSDDGGRPAEAPVLLMPLAARASGARGQTWRLRRAGDIKVNEVLLHALRVGFGLSLDPRALIPEILEDGEAEVFDLAPLFERLRSACDQVEGFDVRPRWVIGNFSFQKLAIVKDLEELGAELASHDLVAGIAGDRTAAEHARGDRSSGDPRQLDSRGPEEEFLVRDADSSQQLAIGATLRGQNGVISGPPGTGKSQTITNLIAELAARGKTVLFVAEKRAALDVVLNRMKEAGLDHLCLDLHGADVSRRKVAAQLRDSLTRIREATVPDVSDLHTALVERRNRLNEHVQEMHKPRLPARISLYQMYGRLLRLPEGAVARTRFHPKLLGRLDPAKIAASAELLREAAGLASLATRRDKSAWNGGVLPDADGVRQAVNRVHRLVSELWPACESATAAVTAESGIDPPITIHDLGEKIEILASIDETLDTMSVGIYRADLAWLATALAPARFGLGRFAAALLNREYRSAVAQVRALSRGHNPRGLEAQRIVNRAARELERWQRICRSAQAPGRFAQTKGARTAFAALLAELTALVAVFPERRTEQIAVAELGPWLTALDSDRQTPARLLRLYEIESALKRNGVGAVFDEIRVEAMDPALWPDVLSYAWLSSWIEETCLQAPTLASFKGRSHDRLVQEFQELDRQRLEVAVARVRRGHAERAIVVRNRYRDQDTLVGREAQKRARHLPFRQLVAQASDVLLALRPCWMASPLSVSQLIPGERPYFDVVIFDEASQVLPEDAVTSLLRGRQAVVAGDRHQLPPTQFFVAGEDEEVDAESSTAGFESVLDVMSAFLDPPWSLDWHYRSRDEALIAFSNHQIYNRRLVTFPGAGQIPALSLVAVPHVPGIGGQEESSAREVQRVVGLVLEHAAERSSESLGVIAMGIIHAKRIAMGLESARRGHPELDEFFSSDRTERFFVKNLERVQGDERDAIILTVGYGKNEVGHLTYRFGPLNQEGGERRLNVAITRARRRMTVVSSFTHADVDPTYPKKGVRLLRAYLEYAASGGTRLDTGTVTAFPLNDFEQSVCDELTGRGMTLVGQLGTSRYRIDLVAIHPSKPGRYVLAIECDGASYHAAPTARDRDRLRQQHLEALGWRFHRIWSTDWFTRREEEIERTLNAYNAAVRAADEDDNDATVEATTDEHNGSNNDPARGRFADASGGVSLGPSPAPSPRGHRPALLVGQTITFYPEADLRRLVRWIRSDGVLRTDEEVVREVMAELGFQKRGSRIVSRIRAAIAAVAQEGPIQ